MHPPERMELNAAHSHLQFRTESLNSEAGTVVMDNLDENGKRKGWQSEE